MSSSVLLCISTLLDGSNHYSSCRIRCLALLYRLRPQSRLFGCPCPTSYFLRQDDCTEGPRRSTCLRIDCNVRLNGKNIPFNCLYDLLFAYCTARWFAMRASRLSIRKIAATSFKRPLGGFLVKRWRSCGRFLRRCARVALVPLCLGLWNLIVCAFLRFAGSCYAVRFPSFSNHALGIACIGDHGDVCVSLSVYERHLAFLR
jgi:hypothetical protein